jgi:phosphotransferase system HPr (HPr) family protein
MNTTTSRRPTKATLPASWTRTARLIVPNAIGLHARPAALLVRTAQDYDAEIVMVCGGRSVNAKSIMGILTLGAAQGAIVTVTAEGREAAEAIRAIEDLFACSFHEEPAKAESGFLRTRVLTVGGGRQPYGATSAAAMSAASR